MELDGFFISAAWLVICFAGEPDLMDALIHALMTY